MEVTITLSFAKYTIWTKLKGYIVTLLIDQYKHHKLIII